MPTPLTPEQLAELRSMDSPTVANAIEAFKVRDDTQGFLGMDVPCHTPEFGVMVGYAVTATANSMAPGRARDRRGLMKLFDAVAAAPKPSVLVIKEVGPKPTHSCFLGDVIATITKRLGAIGIVTDGGVRDLEGVRPLGYHVFAAGFVVAHGTFNIEEVGIPVEISNYDREVRRSHPRRRQRGHDHPAGNRGQALRGVPEGARAGDRLAGLRHRPRLHAGGAPPAVAGKS